MEAGKKKKKSLNNINCIKGSKDCLERLNKILLVYLDGTTLGAQEL